MQAFLKAGNIVTAQPLLCLTGHPSFLCSALVTGDLMVGYSRFSRA